MMRCSCCLSDKISEKSLNLSLYNTCDNCGLIFKPKDGYQTIKQPLGDHYDRVDPHKNVADAKRKVFCLALKHLQASATEDKSILDIGCGYGYFLDFAFREGWQVKGVEIAEDAVEKSRRKFGEKNIFHGTLEKADYKTEVFDAVTLWDVLVFVEDPSRELRECLRILKRGGKLGIRVRNVAVQKLLYQLYHPFRKYFSKLGFKKPYVFHQYCFSKRSMYLLLNRLGYTNIQITMSPLTQGDPYGHTSILGLVKSVKYLIGFTAGFLYKISSGRWILSTSLLVWAEKPGGNNGR